MIWIGAVDASDKQHIVSNKILKSLLPSEVNQLFLSDYIFNELINNITNKQKRKNITKDERRDIVNRIFASIYNSRYVTILKISALHIGTALDYMLQYPDTFSSLTDWLSLILMNENEISVIKTLDPDFKTITQLLPEFKQIQVLCDF
jgi:predicted nucleic acid-binding protein